MAKKNYDKMFKEETVEVAPAEEPVVEEASPSVSEDPVKESKDKETTITKPFMGEVIGGYSLNVRRTPNGEIVSVLAEGAQVRVLDNSNPDWYKIESPEGFVMKKYIKKV